MKYEEYESMMDRIANTTISAEDLAFVAICVSKVYSHGLEDEVKEIVRADGVLEAAQARKNRSQPKGTS